MPLTQEDTDSPNSLTTIVVMMTLDALGHIPMRKEIYEKKVYNSLFLSVYYHNIWRKQCTQTGFTKHCNLQTVLWNSLLFSSQ